MEPSTRRGRAAVAALAALNWLARPIVRACRASAVVVVLTGLDQARAVTFLPISGSLSAKAGDNVGQSTPAVIGSAGLLDDAVDLAIGGFFRATASQNAAIADGHRFTFFTNASSISNRTAPAGQNHATSAVAMSQSFTTTSPQWLELAARVESPPTNLNVFAALQLRRSGQPAPLVSLGHSAGTFVSRSDLLAPGTYHLQAMVETAAASIGAHSAIIEGSILVAQLADFDANLSVDGADLASILAGFGSAAGTFASGNLDGDGDTDGADFLLWQRQIGVHATAAAATVQAPEPASGCLLVCACLVAERYSRTRRSAARRASTSPAR
jgi:hypothetical protein